MNLFEYIKCNRKGKEINRLEKEAMKDPFLADAMEGFDSVKSGSHPARIKKMRASVLKQTEMKKHLTYQYWSAAATVLLIVGICGYFLLNSRQSIVAENVSHSPLDIYAPERELVAQNKLNIPLSTAMQKNIDLLDGMIVSDYETDEQKIVTTTTPQPIIGKKEYQKYLEENVVLPQSEDCKGKRGKVKLRFSIDGQGRPANIRVDKSLCPEADREAVRLIEEGSDWTLSSREAKIEVRFR